jgi:hypothetical protein
MIVSIGDIRAHCPGCGRVEFDERSRAELVLDAELRCTACGRKTSYRDLLDQIGEQAINQANESLSRLRGKKDE